MDSDGCVDITVQEGNNLGTVTELTEGVVDMIKKKRQMSKQREGNDYWQSYSDMMAGLLLMFILVMALTLLQSLHSFEQKNADLDRQQATINEQQRTLEAQQKTLEEQKIALGLQKESLDQVTAAQAYCS